MAGNRKEYKMAIKIAGEIDKSLPESVRLSKAELRAIAREASASSASTATSFRKGLAETKPMFDKVGRVAKKAFKTVTVAATAASVAVGTFSVKTGMEFESQMSTVEALSKASQAEMIQLNKTAKYLGATTVWTAKESGQAMEYMAMAGWDAKQMVDAVPATMDLASASGEELSTVADIVTDSMTAFSLKAEQAGHFTDVLAAAATSSNTNVGKLGESFKYAAPLAGSMGYNIEDTAFALGLMANNGIKAGQAGTSIRSWLTRMAKPTKESEAAMKKLGLSLEDSSGKMKPFSTIIEETRKSFQGLTKSEKSEYSAMIAGKTGMSGLLAIVNSTDKDYKKLRQSIDDCNGAAKEMADTKLDNLEGDVTLFKSSLDGAGMEIYEEMKEPLREIVSSGTKWVGDFAKSFRKNFPTIRRYVSEAGEAFDKLATPLFSIGGWLIEHPDVIVGTISGIGGALASYKLASGVMTLSSSLKALSSGGNSILGITSAIGVIVGVSTAVAKAKQIAKDASLDKHFGNIALSMEDVKAVSKEIVGSKKLEKVSELLDSISKTEGFADSLKESERELNRINWKTSIGIELSDTDKSDYESSVKQYVDSAQQLVDQKGYEVKVGTSLLFDDSIEYTQLLKDNNYFYKELESEVDTLSKKINKKLQKGIKDGFTPDLQSEVDGLINEISEITDVLTESEQEASWDALQTKWSGEDLNSESIKNLQKEVQSNINELRDGAQNALETGLSNASAKKKLGYIDQKEYEAEVSKYQEAYKKTIAEADERGQSFLYNTGMNAYADKMANGTMTGGDREAAKEIFDSVSAINPNSSYGKASTSIGYAYDDSVLSNAAQIWERFTKGDVGGLTRFDFLIPSELKVKTTKDAHEETASRLAKDYKGESAVPIYPEFDSNKTEKETKEITSKIKGDFKSQLEDGVFANIPLNVTGQISTQIKGSGFFSNGNKEKNIKKHAKGGIFHTPHIGMVAEAGYSESIIPIDGSSNSYNLLAKTAQMMGVGDDLSSLASQVIVLNGGSGAAVAAQAGNQSSQPINVHYSPKIIIQGNAEKSVIEGALSDDYEKFKRFMNQWKKESERVSLA